MFCLKESTKCNEICALRSYRFNVQVVISCAIIFGQAAFSGVLLYVQPSETHLRYQPSSRIDVAHLVCWTPSESDEDFKGTFLVAAHAPNMLLICLCTLYAIKARNLPENFNEAKFIGFTMYTTCVVWVGFLTVYFSIDLKTISACVSLELSATVALVLLFFPKLFIILFRPHRNVRSAFTTTKDIRVHIGCRTTSDASEKYVKMLKNSAKGVKYFIY